MHAFLCASTQRGVVNTGLTALSWKGLSLSTQHHPGQSLECQSLVDIRTTDLLTLGPPCGLQGCLQMVGGEFPLSPHS